MSKKTPSSPAANSSNATPPPDQMGFVTADKLTDFDPNFNPDFAQNEAKKTSTKKEVRTQDPISATVGTKTSTKKEVRTQPPKPVAARPKKDPKTPKKPTPKKEVRTQASISPSVAPKKSTKTPKKQSTKKEVRTRSALPDPPKRDKEIQEHLEQYKRSTHSHDTATAYLSMIALLNYGLRPSEIAAESGVHKNTLQRHLNALKKQGRIFSPGYGVWDVLDVPESTKKRSTHSRYVGSPKTPTPPTSPPSISQSDLTRFQQDSVRTHAFTTRWQIPHNLENWNNEQRIKFLESHTIPFKSLNIAGGGQRIMVMGCKVHLLNKAILIYDKASYFAATARLSKNTAIGKHLSIIKHIERLLHVEFLIHNDHKFKVSRQHHALIHDHIAHLYNEAGDKLEVRDGQGLWLIVDNSKDADGNGMNELETIRSSTDNQMAMAANTDSHLELINTIGDKLEELGNGVQTFNSLLEKLFTKLEGGDP
jgi:hypothetical protein